MCSISGFGQTGPYAHRPSNDLISWAGSGLLDQAGYPGDSPAYPGGNIGDCTGGVYGLAAINGALFARERTGKGQYIDIALMVSIVFGAATIVAWMAIEVRNASGLQAGAGLTLVPDAPPWAKWASSNVMLRYTSGWRAMREQLRAAAARAAAAPSNELIETPTVFGAVVFNKDPSALPQDETTIREDPPAGA
jgi:hypothetical protein